MNTTHNQLKLYPTTSFQLPLYYNKYTTHINSLMHREEEKRREKEERREHEE
jgi:hypothetical protein